MRVADNAASARARRGARLLQLTPRAIAASFAERIALFSITEALENLGHSYRDGGWEVPYRAQWASVRPRNERAVLEGHVGWVRTVCPVTVAGQALLASGGTDGTVRIWDPGTGEQLRTLKGHTGGIRAVCPVEIGGHQLLASAGNDGTVRIWDPGTGEQLRTLQGHDAGVNAVCPVEIGGHQLLGSASADRTVRIWDLVTERCQLVVPVHHNAPSMAAFAEHTLVVALSAGLLAIAIAP